MATGIRLITRSAGEPLAIRAGAIVTAGDFLSQVHGLASTLPAAGAIVNLCEDRYRFLVGFAAALVRGLTTLMPPNPLAATVSRICAEWPGSLVLTDQTNATFELPVRRFDEALRGPPDNPLVDGRQLASVTFTSGSTGAPLPQRKSWATLVAGTRINLPYFFGRASGRCAVVATVPAQHMYGFETSALAALQGPVVMHDSRPFYPASVAAALAEAPAPRVLVSTPVHLRALLASGLAFAPIVRVLSATAPLDAGLAAELERCFGAELIEIYGCTEVGSMAARRTASGAGWRFFEGLECTERDGVAWVDAAHLPHEVRLLDALQFDADGSFVLAGRDSDLVKIGGKRASIAEVTAALLAAPGVEDGIAFQLPASGGEARLAALIVGVSADAVRVRGALAAVLDPVFIPRRIIRVPALPRSATGKLTREAVLQLYGEASATGG